MVTVSCVAGRRDHEVSSSVRLEPMIFTVAGRGPVLSAVGPAALVLRPAVLQETVLARALPVAASLLRARPLGLRPLTDSTTADCASSSAF